MAGKSPIRPLLAAILCASMAPEIVSPSLISGNSTLLSHNRTFELGFFAGGGAAESAWYLGIWYASIPIRTYVWVANREAPVPAPLAPPSAALTPDGLLAVTDAAGSDVWRTDNTAPASEARLLDTGNLVLLSPAGATVWQSFDFPADTWLPEMAVTRLRPFTSWRSPSDPSPGLYSLRLRQPDYGEFELVFNGSVRYWSTGNWTGGRFTGVPEMTVPYIYAFRFLSPFTPEASFVYSEKPPVESGLWPLLTRFAVDPSGQLMQYTWSPQAASWNMFWSRPESACAVHGRCGSLGLCLPGGLRPCGCPPGLLPVDPVAWSSSDFSSGCARDSDGTCGGDDNDDRFFEAGAFDLDDALAVSFPGASRRSCEDSCRKNCSCFGLNYDSGAGVCRNLYGRAYNLRNSTASPTLYLRVSASSGFLRRKSERLKMAVLIVSICCLLAVMGSAGLVLTVLNWRRRRRRQRREEGGGEVDEGDFQVTNLRVFTYKELSAATNRFSEKLGHGGFGTVFRGELPDSTHVAVKRLERPGGGDREFRAEVRTIGSIQHVNLVRLRGFCSEESHRLLVYDYMPNGSLSAYLGRDRRRPPISWAVRFRIAVGTARGIAYLHEECRDCIIHCDIKPENILLDGDYTPKVSDFGLAKLMGRDFSRVLATMRGTWGYVAPEWISGTAITSKADVYSYGMTLLEILGGRRNAEAATAGEEEGRFFPPWAARRVVEGDVAGVVDSGLAEVGGYDGREAERAARVAVWCIQDEEAVRPTMGAVVKMLEGTMEVGVPPLPRLLQALVSGDSFRRAGITSDVLSSGGPGELRISAKSDRVGDSGSGSFRSKE